MSRVEHIRELAAISGCPVTMCASALAYARSHEGCTPMGFLKAKGIAVATPNMTFEERVRMFSRGESADESNN